jgi:OOP family OmpA-OmpF porin
MNTLHGLRALTIAGLGGLTAMGALAQAEAGYTYGGLSFGRATTSFDERAMAGSLLGAGTSVTGLSSDTRGNAFKLFGGYQMNRNLAIEAGYFNLGKFGFSADTTPAGTLDGRMKIQGANLDLVGTLPLTTNLSALGRVGAQYSRTRSSFDATGAALPTSGSRKESHTNAKWGLGLQYAISPALMLRAEVERLRTANGVGGHGNVNVASLGLVFPFGREPAPRPVAMYVPPAPMPVVAPAPAPVIVVQAAPPPPPPPPAPPPPPVKVSFAAESLFSFDNASLRPEGQAALDTFARDLSGSQYQMINVEGHTDRLGSTDYNQNLSLQRAERVKAYLVDVSRIDAAKVSAQGRGETQPVTQTADCKGNVANARLIACLQPDRRVDIEVAGTR